VRVRVRVRVCGRARVCPGNWHFFFRFGNGKQGQANLRTRRIYQPRMDRFSNAAAKRYVPVAGVHATRECDTLVRMASDGMLPSLHAALVAYAPPTVRFCTAANLKPHVWLEASMALDAVLRNAVATTDHAAADMLLRYQEALETATANVEHEFLALPIVSVLGAWVGEPDIVAHLEAISPQPLFVMSNHEQGLGGTPTAPSARPLTATSPHPMRVVLVARAGSRQDDAALKEARFAVASRLGQDAVVVLRLGDTLSKEDLEAGPSVAAVLDALVQTSLEARLRTVSEQGEKVRRAVKSTFKSWFGVSAVTKQPLLTAAPFMSFSSQSDGVEPGSAGKSLLKYAASTSNPNTLAQTPDDFALTLSEPGNALLSKHGSAPSPGRVRRPSIGSGSITPLFARDSWEFLSRYAADLQMLTGNFESASEAYRALVSDLTSMSLSGPALAHEAAAVELAAISLSLVDGAKRDVFNGLERAVRLYVRASRRELAVRAALRGADYCMEAGSPEHAVRVLETAMTVIFPSTFNARAQAINTFSEAACSVLFTRIALTLGLQKRHRKASLYAYLAATRFSNLSLYQAAALAARVVCQSALRWPGMTDEIDLLFGRAELAAQAPGNAVSYFSAVLTRATDMTDVEVQSRAIKGLLESVVGGAFETMSRRWDAGALFPVVNPSTAVVNTLDSSMTLSVEDSPESGAAWISLEDEVLEDWSHFSQRRRVDAGHNTNLKRQRSVEATVADLRRSKAGGPGKDPGGSLEMKIKRMREAAAEISRKRREDSLLDRGAVAGEWITMTFMLRNPLMFPVFVESMSAVVTLDGNLCEVSSCMGPHSQGDTYGADVPGGLDMVTLEKSGDVLLMPCSTLRVSVKVMPHRAGILRFVGARWLFSVGQSVSSQAAGSAVPGYCLLARNGRRLNVTRKQRASAIPLYAEDMTLSIGVIPPAPRLEMSLENTRCNNDGSIALRAGEKRLIGLRLVNKGSELVELVVFRTDTPHALYLDVCNNVGFNGVDEENDLGICPALAAGCLTLKLAAGAASDLPAWIYGVFSGDVQIRLAVAYGAAKVRVCRLELKLRVMPSINIFTRFFRRHSCLPDGSSPKLWTSRTFDPEPAESYILGIEVEHAGSSLGDEAFLPESVSVTSWMGWTVTRLPTAKLPKKNHYLKVEFNQSALHVNETATIFVILSKPSKRPNGQEDKVTKSVVDVRESAKENSVSANTEAESRCKINSEDKVSILQSCLEEATGNDRFSISSECAESEKFSEQHGESRASEHFVMSMGFSRNLTLSRESLLVSVRWTGSSGTCGELPLPVLDPTDWVETGRANMETQRADSQSFADKIPSRSPPVNLRFVHPKYITHGFTNSNVPALAIIPAVVPVDVFVCNVSQYPLDVTLSAPIAGGIADGERGRFWGGHVDVTLRSLPVGLERRVCFSAILDCPGSFDLAKLNVTVRQRYELLSEAPPYSGVSGAQGIPSRTSYEQTLSGLPPSLIWVEDSQDACEIIAAETMRSDGGIYSSVAAADGVKGGSTSAPKEQIVRLPSQRSWRKAISPNRSISDQVRTSPLSSMRLVPFARARGAMKDDSKTHSRKAQLDAAWDSSTDTSSDEQ
jgi:hypothetical protein